MILETTLESVVKRDGRVVPFDPLRISQAVERAMEASGEGELPQDADFIAGCVIEHLQRKGTKTPHIEEIQDAVETELIKWQHVKTAKHYILYRDAHARMRKEAREIPEHVRILVEASKRVLDDPLREFVFFSTYAKWIESEKRRETWIETVTRYMDFMKENLGDKLSQEEYDEILVAIRDQDVFPSMRLMWSAGDAARKCNAAAYNCLTGENILLTKEFGNISLEEASGLNNVTVLSHDGKWHRAIVNSFGKQEILEVTLVRGKRSKVIKATKDHRWLLEDGSWVTTQFLRTKRSHKKADRINVVFAEKPEENLDYQQGIVHGIIYGDGTTTYKQNKKSGHLVRLCGSSASLRPFLEHYPGSFPDSYDGDEVVYLYDEWAKSNDLKRLPWGNHFSRSYKLGFIRGWLAADGHVTKNSQTCLATNLDGVQWLKVNSGIVGLPVAGVGRYPDETNFGRRKEALFRVEFIKNALTKDDFLLKHHRSNFKPASVKDRYQGWSVHSVVDCGEVSEVFCATVPATSTFVLDEGIVTGNCAFLGLDSFLSFAELMYLLMSGCGVGFSVESQFTQKLPIVHRQTGLKEPKPYVVEDSREGWCRALIAGFGCWYAGRDTEFDYSEIRGPGERLKTMGGRCAGPEPLRQVLDFTRATILKFQGRRLSNIACHDIACKIGVVVEMGGVRRAAEISLSDLDDKEMQQAKDGHFYIYHPERTAANNSAVYWDKPSDEVFLDEWVALIKSKSGERGIFNRGGLWNQLPSRRLRMNEHCMEMIGLNPCGEIYLRPRQFCNLSNVVARAEDTLDTLKNKVRIAAILGTYQASLTSFQFISPEWEKNSKEEALLGVAVQGQWDCPAFRSSQARRLLKSIAVETNQEYAKRFGINPATAVTCVKPDGNSSQLSGAASGMHPRYSAFYIRRIRINVTDPLFKMMKDQGWPMSPEVGQSPEEATTFVIDFPVKSPDGAITNDDLSAISQLEYWREVKEEFTEHNPSMTCYVSDNEWLDVAQWVFAHWEIVGGLSFLPRTDTVYKLAPYEEISEDAYNEMVAKLPRIDFSDILRYELEDQTTGATTLACVGDRCEI